MGSFDPWELIKVSIANARSALKAGTTDPFWRLMFWQAKNHQLIRVYALYFLLTFVYGIIAYRTGRYLFTEIALDKPEALEINGWRLTMTTICMASVGLLVDRFGIRLSLIAGSLALTLGVGVMAFADGYSAVVLYGLLPFGIAVPSVALIKGLKKYTTKENRSKAFSWYYFTTNAAWIFIPIIIGYLTVGSDHFGMTANRLLFLIGAIVAAIMLLFVFLQIWPDAQKGGFNLKEESKRFLNENLTALITKRVWLVLFPFMICLLGIMLFFPIFWESLFELYLTGEVTGDEVTSGFIIAGNSLCIMAFIPLFNLSKRLSQMRLEVVFLIGTSISAASIFFLAMETGIASAVAFVTVFSLGEALWGPRLNEFVVSIAPEGKEGTYFSLSKIPFALVKPRMGFLSGQLLVVYMPETGLHDPESMWMWIGLITLSTPVLISVFMGVQWLIKNILRGDKELLLKN